MWKQDQARERMMPRPDMTSPYSLRSHRMLESLGTEILSYKTFLGQLYSLVTFQLYGPAGIWCRGGVGER